MTQTFNFKDLCKTHITDKSKYAAAYESIFPEPQKIKKVFEIGIQNGNSLNLWRELFPEAQIVGLDIQPCRGKTPTGCIIYQGGQQDIPLLKKIAAEHGPFDVVIDDASHQFSDQKISYETLIGSTTHYLVEDVPEMDFDKWVDVPKFGGGEVFESTETKERLIYFKGGHDAKKMD